MAELQDINNYIYQAANKYVKNHYGGNNWADYITYDKVIQSNVTASLIGNANIGEVSRVVQSNYVDYKNYGSLPQTIYTPSVTETVTTTNSTSTSIGFNLGQEVSAKVSPVPEAVEVGGSASFSFSFNRTETNTTENSRQVVFPSQPIAVPPQTWTKAVLLIVERTVRQGVKLDVNLSNYISIYARQSWAHGWWDDHPIFDLCAYEGTTTGTPKPSGLTFPPAGTVPPGPQQPVHFTGEGYYEVKGAVKLYMEVREFNLDGTPRGNAVRIVEADPAYLSYGDGSRNLLTLSGK